jgi:hypothetical protein
VDFFVPFTCTVTPVSLLPLESVITPFIFIVPSPVGGFCPKLRDTSIVSPNTSIRISGSLLHFFLTMDKPCLQLVKDEAVQIALTRIISLFLVTNIIDPLG